MSGDVVVTESDQRVVVDRAVQRHVVVERRTVDVVSRGGVGPPGVGNDDGEDGQVWTARDGAQGWEDPAATGATPADIANVMAFAAAQG